MPCSRRSARAASLVMPVNRPIPLSEKPMLLRATQEGGARVAPGDASSSARSAMMSAIPCRNHSSMPVSVWISSTLTPSARARAMAKIRIEVGTRSASRTSSPSEKRRVDPQRPEVQHPDCALEHLWKCPADRHDLADALHLAADAGRHAAELAEVPARETCRRCSRALARRTPSSSS